MGTERANRWVASLQLAARLLAVLAEAIGILVLAGWAFDIAALKSVLPGWVSMKPNAAFASVLMGFAVLSSSFPPSAVSPRLSILRCRLGRFCGLLAGLVGLLSLAEYVFGWNPGIDQWLYREAAGAAGTSHLGRMAPEAAVCLVLLAAALEMAAGKRQTGRTLLARAVLGWLVTTLGVVALLSAFITASAPFGWLGLTLMSAPAALAFALLGTAVVLAAWQEMDAVWFLDGRITTAFACGLTLLVFIGLTSSRNVNRVVATGHNRVSAEQILTVTTRISSEVARARASSRGYSIAGDEKFAKSYLAATARCNEELAALRQLTAGTPRRQRQCLRIESLTAAALAWWQKSNDAHRAGPVAAADELASITRGQALMDDVIAALGQMEDDERRLVLEYQRASDRATRVTQATILIGAAAGWLVFLTAMLELNRVESRWRKAEASLRESEERFRAIFEQAAVGIAQVGVDGRWLRVNEKLCDIVGYTREELLPLTVQDVTHADDLSADLDYKRRVLSGEIETYSMEKRYIRKGGSVIWISLAARLVRDGSSAPKYFVSVVEDISLRKRAEVALRTSEIRFRRLLEMVPLPMCHVDREGVIDFRNRRFMQLVGYTEDELPTLAEWWLRAYPDAEYREWAAETWGEVVKRSAEQGRDIDPIEYRVTCKSGEERIMEISGVTLDKEDLLATFIDHTQRKRAEERLQKSQSLLSEVERIGNVGGWEIDLAKRELVWTEEVYRIHEVETSYQPAVSQMVDFCAPASRPIIARAVQRAIDHGEPFDVELEIVTGKGNLRSVHAIGRADPNRGRVFGFFQDITERKRREEELKRRDDEVTRFTYAVSHDLKSPLVTIRTFLGYLEVDARNQDGERTAKDMAYIRGAADKMAQLLDELLNLSRVGRNVNPFVDEPLADIVGEALTLVAGQIAQRGVTVQVTGEAVLLHGDHPRLVEAFQNLLDNAVKFMGDQPAPRVEIGVESSGGGYEIYVRDNGIGIDPRHRHKLFGLFEKLDPRTEGTGIGLALVRRIVEEHGGKIRVESAGPGLGATFRFTLANTRRQPT
jgi:PAS domain S-box-containing protein